MSTQPNYAVNDPNLIPVSDYPQHMAPIPTSRMFVVKKALKTYLDNMGEGAQVFDASQGDGGKSLAGVPREILDRAHEIQVTTGTGYGAPAGEPMFRKAVAETYWKLDASTGDLFDGVVAVSFEKAGTVTIEAIDAEADNG